MLYSDLKQNPASEGCVHPIENLKFDETSGCVVCTACGEVLS